MILFYLVEIIDLKPKQAYNHHNLFDIIKYYWKYQNKVCLYTDKYPDK